MSLDLPFYTPFPWEPIDPKVIIQKKMFYLEKPLIPEPTSKFHLEIKSQIPHCSLLIFLFISITRKTFFLRPQLNFGRLNKKAKQLSYTTLGDFSIH